jgi:hypothetical protein
MHCWHQAVRITKAASDDLHGEVYVDTARSREAYKRWLEITRSAYGVSPNGTRRPRWLMRPLKPSVQAFALPARNEEEAARP